MIPSRVIRRRFRGLETMVLVEGGSAWAAPGDQRSTVRRWVEDHGLEDRDAFFRWLLESDYPSITPNEVYYFAHLCRYIVRVPAHGEVTTGSIEERGW